MGRIVLGVLLVVPGVFGAVVFGIYALIDWAALEQAYQQFEAARQQSAELSILFTSATQQNIHRLNVFAEGVWFLLSVIIAAIGLHGIYTMPSSNRR
jgi:hypothetical protein